MVLMKTLVNTYISLMTINNVWSGVLVYRTLKKDRVCGKVLHKNKGYIGWDFYEKLE